MVRNLMSKVRILKHFKVSSKFKIKSFKRLYFEFSLILSCQILHTNTTNTFRISPNKSKYISTHGPYLLPYRVTPLMVSRLKIYC